MGKKKSVIRCLGMIIALGLSLLAGEKNSQAATIYDNSYVSFSPDGEAFTTNEGEKDIQWYEEGTTVSTGLKSTIRELETGEHYYKAAKLGVIPVKEWKVVYQAHRCIHNAGDIDSYHGLEYTFNKCYSPLYSGWTGICSDCGESFTPMMIYMSKEAAESLDYVDISKEYYYICPFSKNMEMGAKFNMHKCKAISWNKYEVRYEKNGATGGYMDNTTHMYNNAIVFEGKKITPATKLRTNTYIRPGYEFMGWNTWPDGSGDWYQDKQEIINLSSRNRSVIRLFAQWRRTQNTLLLDPAGGTYAGQTGPFSITQDYGTTCRPDDRPLTPPAGAIVYFDTQGGDSLSPITGYMKFREWQLGDGFRGKFRDGAYTFQGPDGWTDTLTALYGRLPVTLPSPSRSGYSFAGRAGDSLTPERDMSLYAKWVSLLLTAADNYTANDGKGAVDLSWMQPDQKDKTYLLSQQREGAGWVRLLNPSEQNNSLKVEKAFSYSGGQRTYTVPYTGRYLLTANGAQGGAYGGCLGGLGGRISGRFWLEAGEVLTYTVGGQDGYHGGGSADMFANGGGCTVISSDRKGTLLIAGGGGGATSEGDGGAGGSSASVTGAEINGENGGAGGGGGYRGGSSGELIRHYHTADCWKTDDTSYTLLDTRSGDYVHSRIAARKHNIGTWGEAYAAERYGPGGMLGSGAHCGDGDASAYSHYGIVSTPAGEEKVYFPTNGNPTLELHWNGSCWDGNGLKNFSVEVYNEKEDCIFSMNRDIGLRADGRKWFEHPYKEEEFRSLNGGNNFLYGGVSGRVDGEHSWSRRELYINEKIDVSGCTGIRVSVSLLVDDGVWYGQTMNYLALTGGKNTYTICGYDAGEILTSKPAYGGSNYVNARYCSVYTDEAGKQEGNGGFSLSGEALGYQTANRLDGVAAPDLTAPDAPDESLAEQAAIGEDKILVRWQTPADHGTRYRHQAASYTVDETGGLTKSLDSNITENVLATGVSGYYYKVSKNRNETPLTSWAYTPAAQPFTEVRLQPYRQYLLVAAVDGAGNLSGAASIPIEGGDEPGPVSWPVSTGPVAIEEGENVYRAPGTGEYYVRADGETPVTLAFTGSVRGKATTAYQIRELDFWMEAQGLPGRESFRVGVPFAGEITENALTYPAGELEKSVTEPVYLADASYTTVLRSNRLKDAGLTQRFTVDGAWHGSRITAVPRTAAYHTRTGKETWSEEGEDLLHGLTLLPDGRSPEITGMEALEELTQIDRNAGEVTLTLHAWDGDSGLKELALQVKNQDNYCEQTFYGDGEGNLTLTVTQDDYLFYGDFTVTVTAVDQVGNAASVSCGTTEFSLDVTLERMLEPHDPVFQSGETGILTIVTTGYADRVEVVFPPALVRQDDRLKRKVYTYDPAEYREEERLEFMVPLYAEDGEYGILVSAYKGDRLLQEQPVLFTVSGTILDDFRTRLR